MTLEFIVIAKERVEILCILFRIIHKIKCNSKELFRHP